jgi:uncharacterized protein
MKQSNKSDFMNAEIYSDVTPFNQFVVKVSSRCNLNCSYCYMYNMADKTYKEQPRFMTDTIRDAMAHRIGEHAKRHGLDEVGIFLHGGEPLLWGTESIIAFVETTRSILSTYRVEPIFGIQSNGVLISEHLIDALADSGVFLSVSIDGPEEYHNQARLYHNGKGSFHEVLKGLMTLIKHPRATEVFGGTLTVINTDVPPRKLLDFVTENEIHQLDILIPHATHDYTCTTKANGLGDWMVELFDLWFTRDDLEVRIQHFERIMRLLLGATKLGAEGLGTNSFGLLAIETDGGIEPSDNLKPCGDGFTKLKLNVLSNSLDEAYAHPIIRMANKSFAYLNQECMNCSLMRVCGGGQPVERYSTSNGFNNVSVYCADYKRLIEHIKDVIDQHLPVELKNLTATPTPSQN